MLIPSRAKLYRLEARLISVSNSLLIQLSEAIQSTDKMQAGTPSSSMMAKRKCSPLARTVGILISLRYAEMDKAEKNKISHRGVALGKLQAWFANREVS